MGTIVKRRRQSEYLSDMEYVQHAKTGREHERSAALLDLYTKYLPLVRKHATKFNLNPEEREDYETDAYFSVLKVVEYVELSKIDERFSFGYFLRMHLLNQGIARINKLKRRQANVGSQVSYEAVTHEGFTPSELSISEEDVLEEVYRDSDRAAVITAIEKMRLSERDKSIAKDPFLGTPYHETAEKHQLSQQRVRTIQKRVLEDLCSYFADTN